jgi:signal peptidase I
VAQSLTPDWRGRDNGAYRASGRRVGDMIKLIKFLFGVIVVVAIVAVIGRLFFFELARTKSYSMIPTLVPGDVFIVWTAGLIGQGDIAMCANPENPGELVALRVLGVPGDEISFWRNHVKIDDEVVQHSTEDPIIYVDDTSGERFEYAVNVAEEYVGGRLYHVALMDRAGGKEARPVVVPDDQFFVAGDNRNMARDSRNFGTVPIDTCIGKAIFLLWPGKDSGDLTRTDRLLSKL